MKSNPGEKDSFSLDFHAFLGIITLLDDKFLVLVDEVQEAGTTKFIESTSSETKIYLIKSVCLLSLKNNLDYHIFPESLQSLIQEIKTVFQDGIYYSYNYDLTSTLQLQSTLDPISNLWIRIRHKYI